MPGDPTRRLAREIRAARAYADLSRAGLGAEIGVGDETIGRWERGEWKRPPTRAALNEIARVTKIPQELLDVGFLAREDPARRFAAAVKQEARRQGEHHESDQEAPPDAGAGGEGT